jgi:hypothetical protein
MENNVVVEISAKSPDPIEALDIFSLDPEDRIYKRSVIIIAIFSLSII